MTGLADLDELVLRCKSAAAKAYINEATSCYFAGAYRSAIVATWIAVVYDFVDKLKDLELAGDANAKTNSLGLKKRERLRIGGSR